MPPFRVEGLRVTFRAKVKPGADRDRMLMNGTGRVRIDLRATPASYEDNEALIRFLARGLRLSKEAIDIAWSLSTRQKLVRITGYPPPMVIDRLLALTARK
jgi:uncharacterized protein YggU (UPF0235/DUF167 family)